MVSSRPILSHPLYPILAHSKLTQLHPSPAQLNKSTPPYATLPYPYPYPTLTHTPPYTYPHLYPYPSPPHPHPAPPCPPPAFQGPIYLFFSVNASGQFSGMAQMESALDYTKKFGVWAQVSSLRKPVLHPAQPRGTARTQTRSVLGLTELK